MLFTRLARFTIRRHREITIVWLLALAISAPAILQIGHVIAYSETSYNSPTVESSRAQAIVAKEFSITEGSSGVIVITAKDVRGPSVRDFALRLNETLHIDKQLSDINNITSVYDIYYQELIGYTSVVNLQLYQLRNTTVIGTNQEGLPFGSLDLSSVVVELPTTSKRGKLVPGTLKMSGRLFGAPATIDPAAGVTLELGVPDGDRMTSVSATFTMKGKGKSFRGKAHVGDGSYALTLKGARGGFRFQLVGRKLDLAALDTGNTDLTVAFVVSDTNFVKDRTLKAKKSVLKLPKGRA